MTLPYPQMVEDGYLPPPPGPEHMSIDVERCVYEAISVHPDGLAIFDAVIVVPPGADAQRVCRIFRMAVARRLLDRRPTASPRTWRVFRDIVCGQLETTTRADVPTLKTIVQTIDGL